MLMFFVTHGHRFDEINDTTMSNHLNLHIVKYFDIHSQVFSSDQKKNGNDKPLNRIKILKSQQEKFVAIKNDCTCNGSILDVA